MVCDEGRRAWDQPAMRSTFLCRQAKRHLNACQLGLHGRLEVAWEVRVALEDRVVHDSPLPGAIDGGQSLALVQIADSQPAQSKYLAVMHFNVRMCAVQRHMSLRSGAYRCNAHTQTHPHTQYGYANNHWQRVHA